MPDLPPVNPANHRLEHRFTLGLDLDGVTADYDSEMRSFSAGFTGRPASSFPPPVTWGMVARGWFPTEEAFLDTHAAAVADGFFGRMRALPGASGGLHRLSDAGVRIRVITHRLLQPGAHRRVVSDSVQFLDERDIPYSDLCFVKDKTTVGCDLLVDDAPHNILAARDAGVPAVVFDQPYNRHIAGPRAADWTDLTTQVLEAFTIWQQATPTPEPSAAFVTGGSRNS